MLRKLNELGMTTTSPKNMITGSNKVPVLETNTISKKKK